jgi:tRNA uridine 5-carbamoylmethylation protein Kti12
MEKIVIINRAISGSGKTTITNCIVNELKINNISVSVHSTDSFFMVDGKYIFDFDKLGVCHQENFKNFKQSIANQTDVVICDNTNIAPWETEAYTKLAREYNYLILIITLDPRELDEHILSQEITERNPNAHGISEETLKNMICRYYIFDDLLNPHIVIDPKKHINYTWDREKEEKKNIRVSKHFDSDLVLRIMPDNFEESRLTIGKKVLMIIGGKK